MSVAEPRPYAPAETICKYWLTNGPLTTLYTPDIPIHYGFSQTSGIPQIVLAHISGAPHDCLIQHTVWGKDKESNLQLVLNLCELYEQVASHPTPYGTLSGAQPVNYTWFPDGDKPRYILDVRITAVSAT